MALSIKRVYEDPASGDGFRVLVDRLWPRGVSKDKAKLDLWLKDIAPSQELREWFGHKPERFDKFATRYKAEINDNPALTQLKNLVKQHPNLTLLYSAHDTKFNQAVVLVDYLNK